MTADEMDTQIRMLAAERRLPPSHLARWLAMDPASRAAMLEFARVIRLRTGQLMTALETLEEIAVRERVTVAGVSTAPKFGASRAVPAPRRRAPARSWRRFERFATPCSGKCRTDPLRIAALKSPAEFR